MKRTHFRDLRLFNNAGLEFPTCKANAKLLDLDARRLPTTGNIKEVDCPKCLNKIRKEGSR